MVSLCLPSIPPDMTYTIQADTISKFRYPTLYANIQNRDYRSELQHTGSINSTEPPGIFLFVRATTDDLAFAFAGRVWAPLCA